ncbi:MAG: hypothetical protein GXO74_15005 [Calditrichaeota bacterium]|nr:hypothetical protein [Calditrichota bacterium]
MATRNFMRGFYLTGEDSREVQQMDATVSPTRLFGSLFFRNYERHLPIRMTPPEIEKIE